MEVLIFITVVLLLIAWHEIGHYLAAKSLGVAIQCFSIGFGPVLWRIRPKHTLFELRLLPLGGFIRYDERESLPPQQHWQHTAKWRRFIIILAGPVANIVLAWCIWLLLAWIPHPHWPAYIQFDTEPTNQPTHQLMQIGHTPIHTWQDVAPALLHHSFHHPTITAHWQQLSHSTEHHASFFTYPLKQALLQQQPWLALLPFQPWQPAIPPILASVQPHSPAHQVGLMSGDRLLTLNHQRIHHWNTIIHWVQAHPSTNTTLSWQRDQTIHHGQVILENQNGVGYLGASAQVPHSTHTEWQQTSPTLLQSMHQANQTLTLWFQLSWEVVWYELLQQQNTQLLAGPVQLSQTTIEHIESAWFPHKDWRSLLHWIALISLSIGLLNLLPIPLLDGAQAWWLFVQPHLPDSTKAFFESLYAFIGLMAIIILAFLAIRNDLIWLLAS